MAPRKSVYPPLTGHSAVWNQDLNAAPIVPDKAAQSPPYLVVVALLFEVPVPVGDEDGVQFLWVWVCCPGHHNLVESFAAPGL